MKFSRMLLASIFLALPLLIAAPKPKKGQTQPDAKRVAEIQQALTDHGYDPGKTWRETRATCRKIADEHGWQNMFAPDSRVLFLLGLAPNLNLTEADLKPNSLDEDERKWVEQHGGEQARDAE
jgi:hypothetical protein